jgi:hypothetical protein
MFKVSAQMGASYMEIKKAAEMIEKEIKAKGFSIEYTKGLTGKVYSAAKRCFIPYILTRKSLYVACHQLSHVLGNVYIKGKSKRDLIEFRAEEFAHQKMKELGISVPREMTERAAKLLGGRKIRRVKKRFLRLYFNRNKSGDGKLQGIWEDQNKKDREIKLEGFNFEEVRADEKKS